MCKQYSLLHTCTLAALISCYTNKPQDTEMAVKLDYIKDLHNICRLSPRSALHTSCPRAAAHIKKLVECAEIYCKR